MSLAAFALERVRKANGEMDVDAAGFDHHVRDDRSEQVLAVFEWGEAERLADAARESLQRDPEAGLLVRGRFLVLKRRETPRHVRPSLVQEILASSELFQRDEARLVGVEQSLRFAV
jgi:hypothetical protein